MINEVKMALSAVLLLVLKEYALKNL